MKLPTLTSCFCSSQAVVLRLLRTPASPAAFAAADTPPSPLRFFSTESHDAEAGRSPSSTVTRSQSGFIGVWTRKGSQNGKEGGLGTRWIGVVSVSSRRHRVGPFSSPLEAAIARDSLAWELLGPRAQYNFERTADGKPDPSTPARPHGKPTLLSLSATSDAIAAAASSTAAPEPTAPVASSSFPASACASSSSEATGTGAFAAPVLPPRCKPFRSRFIGVHLSRSGLRWQARLGIGKKEKRSIGFFATELEAAVAFDKACYALRGESGAVLNFHRDPVTGEPDITKPTGNVRPPPFFQRQPGAAAKAAQMRWKSRASAPAAKLTTKGSDDEDHDDDEDESDDGNNDGREGKKKELQQLA